MKLVTPVFTVTAVLVTSGFFTSAQAQTEPERLLVTVTKVKPDRWTEYMDLMAQLTEVSKKTDAKVRMTWSSGMFGDRNTVITATPITKYANFDSPSPTRTAMGEGPYQRWTARVMSCIDSSVRTVETGLPELSINNPRDTNPKLAVINTVHVMPGKSDEYEALIKGTLVPAWKKAGAKHVYAYRQGLGGHTNTYTFVWLLDSYAELDTPNATRRGLGEAGYKAYVAKLVGLTAGSETQVVRYEDKLSFRKQ